MTFDEWVSETYPDLVGGPKALMRSAWDAMRELAAGVAEKYSRFPDDESWQHTETGFEEGIVAVQIAARIRQLG